MNQQGAEPCSFVCRGNTLVLFSLNTYYLSRRLWGRSAICWLYSRTSGAIQTDRGLSWSWETQ